MPESVDVRIRFFGKARELMLCEEKWATVPTHIAYPQLKNLIFHELYSDLQSIETACILAVDHRYLSDAEVVNLCSASEIAVIPPLSGG